ncbi:hypothetical protein ZHAS_00018782 [Anopheles sinensis]|uniref:Uncharacterized protein n=1 Tax=Anopheles sinensis TaxID=74873 RepID=A0A084WK11_ANOSI|nr:hypothetical protein ZHAS_00018782 [Anopheles sinensis]
MKDPDALAKAEEIYERKELTDKKDGKGNMEAGKYFNDPERIREDEGIGIEMEPEVGLDVQWPSVITGKPRMKP